MLRKIHTIGVKHGPEHPDTRAVLYEEALYGKKKIMDLLTTLDGRDRYFLFGFVLSLVPGIYNG